MVSRHSLKTLRRHAAATATVLGLAAFASAAPVTGGTTSVVLNSATVTALTGLGLTITPVAPATLGGMPLTAVFPITGGNTSTMIDHSGGLDFAAGMTTAIIQNFIINLSGAQANTITGQLVAGGQTTNGVALFDIGSGLSLTLDAQLAHGLSTTFGAPDLTGASVGTATVNAITATPEPASEALAALGILVAGFMIRRRKNSRKA